MKRESSIKESKHDSVSLDDIKKFNRELNSWDYGVLINGKKYVKLDDVDWSKYKTIPINDIEKYHVGICWDFVNYQHHWFKKNHIKDESYMFVMQLSDNPNDIVTHTFSLITFELKKYWFESSWGSHQHLTIVNGYKDVINELVNHYDKEKKHSYSVFRYNPDGMDKNISNGVFFNKATSSCIYDHKGIDNIKESEENVMNGIITLESGEKLDIRDVLIEAYESMLEEDDEIIEEGANIEETKIFMNAVKSVKESSKQCKKNIKKKNFKKAKDNVADIEAAIAKAKKEIENIEGTTSSAVMGFFANGLIEVCKYMLVALVSIPGMATGKKLISVGSKAAFTAGIAISTTTCAISTIIAWATGITEIIRQLVGLINDIKKKDEVTADDFNMYKRKLIMGVHDMETYAKKLSEIIDKCEKEEKNNAKKSKKEEAAVKESADFKAKKLEIYESCSRGEITIEESEQLLEELSKARFVSEGINDAVIEDLSSSKKEIYEKAKVVLYERCSKGYITVDQREALIEEAYNQIFAENTAAVQPVQPVASTQNDKAPDTKDMAKEMDNETKSNDKEFQKTLDSEMKKLDN